MFEMIQKIIKSASEAEQAAGCKLYVGRAVLLCIPPIPLTSTLIRKVDLAVVLCT